MGKTIIKKFDSPYAYLQWATNAPVVWEGELASREKKDAEWTGTKTYEEAYKLALYGWPEGLKQLSEQVKLAEELMPPVPKRKKRYDVAGRYPSPGRAAAGEMFSMVTQGEDFKDKPVLRIRNNFTFNANEDKERIIKWGAAICSYVNMLESNGWSVQLDAVFESEPSYESDGPGLSFQFPLKKAGDPLSLASIVFWWAHPAALRRIEFSADERLDIERWYGSDYGRRADVTKAEPGTLSLSFNHAAYDLEENLEIIREKHLKLIKKQPGAHKPALTL